MPNSASLDLAEEHQVNGCDSITGTHKASSGELR
jgi:hypothetical protein